MTRLSKIVFLNTMDTLITSFDNSLKTVRGFLQMSENGKMERTRRMLKSYTRILSELFEIYRKYPESTSMNPENILFCINRNLCK